ncbi:MAG: hypothetical protein ABI769_09950 [Pseudomonadota bacterium]
MKMKRILLAGLSSAAVVLAGEPVVPQAPAGVGSSASISVGGGPHAGKYAFAPTEACVIAAFGDKPLSLSVVLSSENSSLSVDMPSLEAKHANEIQIVLVVADTKAGATKKGTASTTYEIDTRPDAVLEPYQKAERANRGMAGKAKTQLMTQGSSALLSFSGETATGVKLDGEITCRKM